MDLREQLQTTLGDNYTVERELGGGGMARVFLAEERALGRKVVVKVLSNDMALGISGERFSREIKLAARLQQANIVPLMAAGDANGIPYYTMPFVEGQSLRQRLAASGALPVAHAVNVLRDIARALAYAHERGIVHRDIKPENVLLSGDAAVVTDFGIAKAVAVAKQGDRPEGESPTDPFGTALTSVGTSIGTPAYMAPEQALGDPNTDHRADLYAFGCVAFELLAGRPPFSAPSPQQLLAAHVHETPQTIETLRPEAPVQLASLIRRCLEKNPDARPQSAREILQSLDTLGSSERSAVVAAFARMRGRRVAFAAGLVILAVAIAVGALTRNRSSASSASSPRTLAVMPFTNVGGDSTQEYFADGIAIELTNALNKVPGLSVTSRSLAFSMRNRASDVRAVGRALGVGAVLGGAVQRAGNRLRVTAELTDASNGLTLWSNRYEQEISDVFKVQDAITKAIVAELRLTLGPRARPGADSTSVAGTQNFESYDQYLRGVYALDHRGPGVARSVEHFKRAVELDSGFARAYGKLSEALALMTFFTETPAGVLEAPTTEAANRALAIDSSIAEAHIGLAMARSHAFHWAAADSEFQRALAADPNSAVANLQYGRFLMHEGRLGESLKYIQTAARLDPASGTAFIWWGHLLSMSGLVDSALVLQRHARDVDAGLLLGRNIGAIDALAAGRPDEARALVSGVVASAPWQGQIGWILAQAGDTAEAREILRRLQRLPTETWMLRTGLMWAYLGIGDTTKALTALEGAVQARDLAPQWTTFADRVYDPIRGSARFAAAMRGFGLDERLMVTAPSWRTTGGRAR
jgi:serine/threonine-protein kinase